MKISFWSLCLFFALALLFAACDSRTGRSKLGKDDPFTETIVPSEFFEIDGSRDTILFGEKGTVLRIPALAFEKDGKGYPGKIKIELAEIYSVEDMMRSGISITSGDSGMETKGTVFISALADGTELVASKGRAPIIDMPASGDLAGYRVFKSARGDSGKMDWAEAADVKKFLTTVPAENLNFLPPEFVDSCRVNFLTLGWKKPEMRKMEKLYASLQNWESGKHYDGFGLIDLNEDILTGINKVNDIQVSEKVLSDNHPIEACEKSRFLSSAIMLLKKKEYESTFIHTKAFQERVQYLILSEMPELIRHYAVNLEKDLWMIDEQIATGGSEFGLTKEQADSFAQFAAEKLTNVKDAPEHIRKLSLAFEKAIQKMESETDALSEKFSESVQVNLKPADEKLVKDYKKLLWKREAYRMEKLSFEFRGNSWYCAARPIDEGDCPFFWKETVMKVENRMAADRVFVYVFFEDIFSIARLQEHEPGEYHTAGLAMNRGEDCERNVLMVAIGFKGKKWFMGFDQLTFKKSGGERKLTIKEVTEEEKDKVLGDMEKFAKHSGSLNSMKKDLDYQLNFYAIYKKGLEHKREYDLLDNLEYVGNFFCYSTRINDVPEIKTSGYGTDSSHVSDTVMREELTMSQGKMLFVNYCSSCHGTKHKVVGPALGSIGKKRPIGWLVKFTRDNKKMLKLGDPMAKKVFYDNAEAEMSVYHSLSDSEIKRIIYYLDHASDDPDTDARHHERKE